MNIKSVVTDFVTVFVVTLLVTAVVTFLWNLVVHGISVIDWETSFRFAIILGIILTWTETRRSKAK